MPTARSRAHGDRARAHRGGRDRDPRSGLRGFAARASLRRHRGLRGAEGALRALLGTRTAAAQDVGRVARGGLGARAGAGRCVAARGRSADRHPPVLRGGADPPEVVGAGDWQDHRQSARLRRGGAQRAGSRNLLRGLAEGRPPAVAGLGHPAPDPLGRGILRHDSGPARSARRGQASGAGGQGAGHRTAALAQRRCARFARQDRCATRVSLHACRLSQG